ncbi:SnoaL-like domain protein [compost metagenome]
MDTPRETVEIGKKLVDFCKQGENLKAVNELYADEIVSLESMSSPESTDQAQGIEAIRRKNKQWDEEMEVHSMDVQGPFPLGDRFAVHFKFDATERKNNKRMKMEEVGLYTVKNGKIVKEEFFYTM